MVAPPSRLIAIEGLNGVGKSTLARALARRLGAALVNTPPDEARSARVLFDDAPFSLGAQLFYLSWVKRLSDILATGSLGPLVVCDRYLGSTISYAHGAGSDIDWLVSEVETLRPTLTVLVTTEEWTRRKRLRLRDNLRKIDVASLDETFRYAAHAAIARFDPLLTVDTTNRSVAECSKQVAMHWAKLSLRDER